MTYRCNDTTLGINRNSTTEVTYTCVIDEPTGRFNVPRADLGEAWPACLERTTTPHPGAVATLDTIWMGVFLLLLLF